MKINFLLAAVLVLLSGRHYWTFFVHLRDNTSLFGLHHRLQLFRKLDLKYVFVEAKRFVKGGQQYLFKYLTTLHFSYYGVKLS